MALTRRMLKGMSLTDEQIDTIIEAHTDTTDALKDERDRYKADAEKLSTVQMELEALKAKGDDGFEKKYNDLKEEYDSFKKEQQAKAERAAVESAYRAMLREAGISDKRISAVMRVADLSGVKLEKDGKLKDYDKLIDGVKAEWSDFIQTTETKGAETNTPPLNTGGGKLTKAEIYAKDGFGRYKLSASERQKALAENMDLMRGN